MNKAVFDSWLIIHLCETDSIKCLELFERIVVPAEVASELKKGSGKTYEKIRALKAFEEKNLAGNANDFAMLLAEKFELGFGEASAIALAKQERIKHFFTDDLSARETAKQLGFEVHGTIGILLRAFREGILPKNETIEKLKALRGSSLFITKPLIEKAIIEVENFGQQGKK